MSSAKRRLGARMYWTGGLHYPALFLSSLHITSAARDIRPSWKGRPVRSRSRVGRPCAARTGTSSQLFFGPLFASPQPHDRLHASRPWLPISALSRYGQPITRRHKGREDDLAWASSICQYGARISLGFADTLTRYASPLDLLDPC